MDISELIASEGYADAARLVAAWKGRLETAGLDGAMAIRDEKAAFFKEMRASSPELYMVFQLDDRELSERIYKRMTGKGITID